MDASKRSAHYCIANLSLNDWLPVVDFRSPEHFAKFDSTAGMAIVAGLLELAEHVNEIPAEELTISIFRNRCPRELFKEWKRKGIEISHCTMWRE